MSAWARRVHRGATSLGQAVASCGGAAPYPMRLEKVKFGVPLEQVCTAGQDLPAPLLVLVLKLNKEAPTKKDVFRAPGHQVRAELMPPFPPNVITSGANAVPLSLPSSSRSVSQRVQCQDGRICRFALALN